MDRDVWTFRCFPDSFPPSNSCVLAGFVSGCPDVPGVLYYLSGTKVSVSTACSHGTCRSRSSMGSIVAMDLLDLSVTSAKGNRYVLVKVDCFSRWTEACPLPDKTALSVADTFFQYVVCRFGMPSVIHSDQGWEFENKVMQELCLICAAHKTRTYYAISSGESWLQ